MWIVEYYKTRMGQCPTEEFLNGLNKKIELPPILRDIKHLKEFGNMLRRPQADLLRDHIYELRTDIGHMHFRLLYFFFYNEKIVISHGTSKKRKVPSQEIDRAIENRRDYFDRYARKE